MGWWWWHLNYTFKVASLYINSTNWKGVFIKWVIIFLRKWFDGLFKYLVTSCVLFCYVCLSNKWLPYVVLICIKNHWFLILRILLNLLWKWNIDINMCRCYTIIFETILNLYLRQSQRRHIDVSSIIKCDKNNISTHNTTITEVLPSVPSNVHCRDGGQPFLRLPHSKIT